jgi:hypothetical protein
VFFTNTSIFKSVIIFSSSPIFINWLYVLYKSAINIIFATLSLILNYYSLEFTITIYRGLFTKYFLFYIPYNPYISFNLNLSSVLYYRGLYSDYNTPILRIWIKYIPIIYSNSIVLGRVYSYKALYYI